MKYVVVNQTVSKNCLTPFIDCVSSNNENHEIMWCKDIFVDDKLINFKTDTGAETNILPFYLFNNLKLYENANLCTTNVVLISYGNYKLKPEGEVSLFCFTEKCKNVKFNFTVVNIKSKPILGLSVCKLLNLVQRVNNIEIESKNDILNQYNEAFKGLGKFPDEPYHIELKENVIFIIDPLR